MYKGSYEFELDELLNVGFEMLPLIGCSDPHFGRHRLVTNGWYDISSILIHTVGHGMCTRSHPGSSLCRLVAHSVLVVWVPPVPIWIPEFVLPLFLAFVFGPWLLDFVDVAQNMPWPKFHWKPCGPDIGKYPIPPSFST